MKTRKSDVWPVAGRAFPDYTGRMFALEVRESVTLYDLNWGGGTRNEYRAVELATDGCVNAPAMPAPWLNLAEGKTLPIPAGWALVEHSIACGHDMGLRLYIGPADAPKLLTNLRRTKS